MMTISHFCWNGGGKIHVFVLALELGAFLKEGITISGIEKVLSKDEGVSILAGSKSMVLHIAPGSVAFVPWGYVTTPLFVDDGKDKAPGGLMTIPNWDYLQFKNLATVVQSALSTFTKAQYSKSTKEAMVATKGFLEEFFVD